MNKPEYDIQANEVANIIDIAIRAFKDHPSDGFSESDINHFVNTYSELKDNAINPEPKFANLKSLKQVKSDALIFFQEGSGKSVDCFWKTISEQKIPLKRETNKLDKILKKGKIKDEMEYDWLIDTYTSFSLTDHEIDKINGMIEKFENGK